MTNRFNKPNTQYFDNSGNVLAGGKLRFKATGSDTLKDTYSNTGLTSANTNPVVLDSSGRHGDIFLNGTYRVELLTSADVQLWQRDPIGDDSSTSPWADWVSDRTYAIDDIVQGSDVNYYKSITANNSGNNPTSSPSHWAQIKIIEAWNTNQTYANNEIAESSGVLYKSLAASNTGNAVTDTSKWHEYALVEVGTFTPTLNDSATAADESQAYNEQVGNYTKIGNRVFFDISIELSSKGTLTSSAQVHIHGLPYSSKTQTDIGMAVVVGVGQGFAISAGQVPCGSIESNQNYIRMGLWDGTAGPSQLLVSEVTTGSNNRIAISGNYPTA